MAKTVNITDKISFDENPNLRIGELEVEVNADAETILKIMGVLSEVSETQAVIESMNLLFKAEDVEKIMNLKQNGKKLTGKSLQIIVKEAINLVIGDEEGE